MKTLKTDFYLEVEHKGTTFQVPKQSGNMLYIRFIHGSDEDIIIQVDFPSDSPDPLQLAMSYNMEPEKRKYVSDDDLQHIGEALTLLTCETLPDESPT